MTFQGKDSIYKGRKMPGHMGMEYRKLMGLKVCEFSAKHPFVGRFATLYYFTSLMGGALLAHSGDEDIRNIAWNLNKSSVSSWKYQFVNKWESVSIYSKMC